MKYKNKYGAIVEIIEISELYETYVTYKMTNPKYRNEYYRCVPKENFDNFIEACGYKEMN